MPKSPAAPTRFRTALLAAVLLAVPALASAQRRSAAASRVEAVVVTVPAVRVRTAPSLTSLSIDDFTQGTVFPLAPDEYQSNDWYGVMVDGRIAYLPRGAAAPRARGSRAVIAEPVEVATVIQAGAPAAAAAPPAVDREPAPIPARTAPAERAATRQPAAVEARTAAAPPVQAPAPAQAAPQPAQQVVAQAPAQTSAATPTVTPAATPAAATPAAPTPANASRSEQPAFNARRAGLGITAGMLGSVTPIKATNGLTPSAHIAGLSFLSVRYRMLGIYGAPEYGQGGGYRSTMVGGGVSLDLVDLHALRISALGGYTTYTETTMPTDSTVAPVTAKLQGPSIGGMVSIPFIGPLRLAYRGQYVMAEVAGVPTRMTRHSVGLVF